MVPSRPRRVAKTRDGITHVLPGKAPDYPRKRPKRAFHPADATFLEFDEGGALDLVQEVLEAGRIGEAQGLKGEVLSEVEVTDDH